MATTTTKSQLHRETASILLIATKGVDVLGEAIQDVDGEEEMKIFLETTFVCRHLMRLNSSTVSIRGSNWLVAKGQLVVPISSSEKLIAANCEKMVRLWIFRVPFVGAALGVYTDMVYFDDKKEPDGKWFSTLAKIGFALPISSIWKACDEGLQKAMNRVNGSTETARTVLKVSKFLNFALEGIIQKFDISPSLDNQLDDVDTETRKLETDKGRSQPLSSLLWPLN